jgi:hypothetical protein
MEQGPVSPWASCSDARFYEPHWDEVLDALPLSLIPDNLFSRSKFRDGYAQWDAIAAAGVTECRGTSVLASNAKEKEDVLPVRKKHFNNWWFNHVRPVRARGEHVEPPYYRDLRWNSDAMEMLSLAHTMTHYRCDDDIEKLDDFYLHGTTAFEFIQSAAELFVADVFGLRIDPKPGNLTALEHGVYVYPDIRLGFEENPPQARMPAPERGHKVFDDILVVVLVVVELGPDPRLLTAGTPNPIEDWWSYQPSRMYVAGWETALWMSQQKTKRGYKVGCSTPPKTEFVSHVNDLLPPHMLKGFLQDLPKSEDKRFNIGLSVLDKVVERTPLLPCNSCFCSSGEIDNGLVLPRGSKPRQWNPRKYKDDENFQLWVNYRSRLKIAMAEVDKAKRRYYHSANYTQARAARKRACRSYRREKIELRRKRNKW